MQTQGKNNTVNSIFWKLLERFGFHGVKLLVQILLARILMPSDFGTLSIVLVFVEFATIFVQSGLNTALIQKKDADAEDFSTIFWFVLGFALVLYSILFFAAPIIAGFYENSAITQYLRVLGLMLFGGAANSIQIAYASKRFDFKSQFICNLIAVIVSGSVSIVMAFKGMGIWALVTQQLIWQYLSLISMSIRIKWKPLFVFRKKAIKNLFVFGSKMLLSSILIKVNTMISNLIVGKRFSAESLGYYGKAGNLPTAFSDVAVNALSSVALVSFSSLQERREEASKQLIRYISLSMFFIAPMMLGLAGIAKPFVTLLLTEKWLPCVPYLRIFCCLYLFQPVCAIYGQAVSGMGRSDLYLRVFLIVKPIGIALMFAVSLLTKSAVYLAATVVLTSVLETLIQAWNIRKVFGLSYRNQFGAWIKPVISAFGMACPVFALSFVDLKPVMMILIQIIAGAAVYFALSYVFNRRQIGELFDLICSKTVRRQ